MFLFPPNNCSILLFRSTQRESKESTLSSQKKKKGRDDSSSDDDDGLDRFLSNQRRQDVEESQSNQSSPKGKVKAKKRRVRKSAPQSDDRYPNF